MYQFFRPKSNYNNYLTDGYENRLRVSDKDLNE